MKKVLPVVRKDFLHTKICKNARRFERLRQADSFTHDLGFRGEVNVFYKRLCHGTVLTALRGAYGFAPARAAIFIDAKISS